MLKTLAKALVEPFPQVAQLYRGLRDQSDRNQSGLPTQWRLTFAGYQSLLFVHTGKMKVKPLFSPLQSQVQ
jgi:hypothetical protein